MMIPSTRLAFIPALTIAVAAGIGTAKADDVQVNTYTTSAQIGASVALDAVGDFVVVWHTYGTDYYDPVQDFIGAQRYTADGSAAGGEFQVNAFTTDFQGDPSVATDSDGDFVVVWNNTFVDDPNSYRSLQAQRYAPDGSPAGDAFQVDSYTTAFPLRPRVAMGDDGAFVVVWDLQVNYSRGNIHGRLYASDGSAVAGEFQVNTYATNRQRFSRVAMDNDGAFVVVWVSPGSGGTDSSDWSIQGQRYASDGSSTGDEFQINTYTTSFQTLPSVSIDADGDFVVAWQSQYSSGSDLDGASIQGQRFASDGSAVAGEFQVNTYTSDGQFAPAVSMAADGEFLIVWQSQGSGGTDSSLESVQGQHYASDGAPAGDQFQINTYTSSFQWRPEVSVDDAGNFVAVWESDGSGGTDASELSIQMTLSAIFTDGFESGDTSSWSTTVTLD